MIIEVLVLVYYNLKLLLIIFVDVSLKGLGVIIL